MTQVLPFFQKRILWKIILPFALLSLVVALVGTYVTAKVVSGSLGERFDNQLAEAARVTADAFVRRERKHLEVVRAVTFTEGVGEATANRDTARLERLVLPIAANAGTERIEILDAEGRLLYGARRTEGGSGRYAAVDPAEEYVRWEPLSKVLAQVKDDAGDKHAGLVRTEEGHALYSAGPLTLDGQLVGAVLVGTRVQSLLSGVKLEALSDITLYAPDGTVFASTVARDNPDDFSTLTPSVAAWAGLTGGKAVREAKTLSGRDFDFLYGSLLVRGEVVVAYSVALPASFIASAAALTRMQMTAVFGLATIAVILVGWLVAKSLTRPVVTLARTAESVSEGDLSARSGVTTGDEIGFLAQTFDKMTAHLQRQHLSTIQALASAIDARDPYTLGHSMRVGQLASSLGTKVGLSSAQVQHLEIGGYLHDIGKIGIRDSVLLKPGALTDEERCRIEEHPLIGLRIIEPIELPDAVRDFVRSHHEKLDGSGYPESLRESELSIFARIGAVADMYDALITDRPYRPALTLEAVLDLLFREVKDGRLDLSVVRALESIAPEWEERRLVDRTLQGLGPLIQQESLAS